MLVHRGYRTKVLNKTLVIYQRFKISILRNSDTDKLYARNNFISDKDITKFTYVAMETKQKQTLVRTYSYVKVVGIKMNGK